MKQLNEQKMHTHAPIVGWLLIAHSLLQMVAGLFIFALIMSGSLFWTQLGQVGSATTDPDAARIFALFNTLTVLTAILIGGLVIGLAIPALVAGIGVLNRKPWAQILGFIVSVFALMTFPIGTLIGIYAIVVLLQDAATDYFASPSARMPTSMQPA
jgi:hypothetical protein